MTDRIDINEPINALCGRLGLRVQDVAEIIVRPAVVTAVVYKTNDNGAKYVDANGDIASEIREFEVQT